MRGGFFRTHFCPFSSIQAYAESLHGIYIELDAMNSGHEIEWKSMMQLAKDVHQVSKFKKELRW